MTAVSEHSTIGEPLIVRYAMRSFNCCLICLLSVNYLSAEDWPQFQGPFRDGSTTEIVRPWQGETLSVVWTKPAGNGFSIPVVSEGRVFVHSKLAGKEEEELLALSATDGKELWRASYKRPPYSSVLGSGPRATPCVALGRVYGYGISGMLSCHQASDGKQLWLVDTYKLVGAKLPRFGVCCSPLVIGNRVLVSIGGKGSSVAAFDADTGELAWKTLDEPASTTSPIAFQRPGANASGIPDAVFITTLRVVGLNPLDGTVNWDFPLPFQPSGTTPSPVPQGDLILTSSTTNGGVGLRIETANEKPTTKKAWQNTDLAGYFSSPVFSKKQAYMVTVTTEGIPTATLRCVDAGSGKELWKKTGVGSFHAALVRTGDDRLLLLTDAGVLKLFEPDAGSYKELASAKVCKGTFVAPVVAQGMLFTRDGKEVTCHQIPTKAAKTP